ncbi:unnamed protein product [Lampetra fluviatilis]
MKVCQLGSGRSEELTARKAGRKAVAETAPENERESVDWSLQQQVLAVESFASVVERHAACGLVASLSPRGNNCSIFAQDVRVAPPLDEGRLVPCG